MMKRWLPAVFAVAAGFAMWGGAPATAKADNPPLPRFAYYPYYYFPHSYWPTMSPQWPEPPGSPYMRPPAYMAYPPFKEPNWRHDLWMQHKYYRGHHFWLDIY
jgi:hypothetical protein